MKSTTWTFNALTTDDFDEDGIELYGHPQSFCYGRLIGAMMANVVAAYYTGPVLISVDPNPALTIATALRRQSKKAVIASAGMLRAPLVSSRSTRR